MKKIVSICLLIGIILSFSACSSGSHYRGEHAEEKRAEARMEEEMYKYEQEKAMREEIYNDVIYGLGERLKYSWRGEYVEIEQLIEAIESYADSEEEAEDMIDCILYHPDLEIVSLYDVYKNEFRID